MSGVIVHELYADLNKTEIPHYDKITLRAGNDNDIIVAHILNDGVEFKAFTQFTFSCVKSDGHVYISDKISGNGSIRYTVNSQVVAVGGELRNAYFTLYNGGELVGSTPDLPIKVLRDADSSLGSSDYVNGLDKIKQDVEDRYQQLAAEIKVMDFTADIQKTIDEVLTEKKAQINDQINKSIGEINTLTSQAKNANDKSQQVLSDLNASLNNLKSKTSDADTWLDSLHKEFSDKNDAYMASVKKTVDDSITSMQNSASSALTKMQSDIAGLQGDINSANAKVAELNDTIKKASDAVADINIPQIKADVDTANNNSETALQEVVNKANKSDLIQLVTDLINDNPVQVYSDGGSTTPTVTQLKTPAISVNPSSGQVIVSITTSDSVGVKNYQVDYSTNGTSWTTKTTTSKSLTITGLTNGTVYQFRAKSVANSSSYSDSGFSTIAKATPNGVPATKLSTPSMKVDVDNTTITYTITDKNSTGVKGYVINGLGSDKTVTSKTGTLTGVPSTKYNLKVKTTSSDATKYTDSDYSQSVVAQLYAPDPVDSDFTVSVTDTTATVIDNNKTMDRSNEYLVIFINGGGEVAKSAKGSKSATLTELTPSKKYDLGSYWLGYRGADDGTESGKIAVPEFTTSGGGSVTPPVAEEMNIDFSKKKVGDSLPYKAYIAVKNANSNPYAYKYITDPTYRQELTNTQYQEISKYTSDFSLTSLSSEYPKNPILIQITPAKFPANLNVHMDSTTMGNTSFDGVSAWAGYGVTLITSSTSKTIFNPDSTKNFTGMYSNDNDEFTIEITDNHSDWLSSDGSIWIVIGYSPEKKDVQFKWDPTLNTISYPTEQINALTESLDSLETVDDSIMPTAYSMAPMMLASVANNIITKRLSENFVKRTELADYAHESDLSNLLTPSQADLKYISASDVAANYISKTDVSRDYIKKSEIDQYIHNTDTSQFVTVKQMQQAFYNLLMKGNVTITNSSGNDSTSTLNNAVSQLDTMSTFAKVAEIPTINKNNNFNDDWYGTQSQYDGLASKSSTTNYHITE